MFCLFCTIPVDKNNKGKVSKLRRPSVARSIITWGLVSIWVVLIIFGIVASTDPPWLEKLATYGRESESRQVKENGDFFLRERNYRMALAQYQRALKINPDYTGAIVNSAIAYNLSGNPEQGIRLLESAKMQNPDQMGTIEFNIAEIYESMERFADAIEHYKLAIDTEMETELVFKKLINLYNKTEQHENARQTAERLLDIQNDPLTPYVNMLKKYSFNYLDKPEHLTFFDNAFKSQLAVDDLSEYDFKSIIEQNQADPEIAKTHNILAFQYAMQGNIDKAIEHFENSDEIWPGNIDARKNLPILRRAKGQQSVAEISQ